MIDLHMHSEFSIDSRDAPEALIAQGCARGVTTIALTEHENLYSLSRGKAEAHRLGIDFIPGIEIGAEMEVGLQKLPVHILGYFFAEEAPRIRGLCDRMNFREKEMSRAAARGFQVMRIALTAEAVEEAYPGRFSLWALKRCLRETGIAKNKVEATKLMAEAISTGSFGSLSSESGAVPAAIVLEAMKADGATTFMAHPFWLMHPSQGGYAEATIWEQIRLAGQMGIDGLEAFNTGSDPDCSPRVLEYCQQHNLPACGGSDSHGVEGVGEKLLEDSLLLSMQRYREGCSVLWD